MTMHDKRDQSATRSKRARSPRLLRFLAQHLLVGVLFGIALAVVIASFDVGGFRSLLAGDQNPYLAMFLLIATFALTFGSLAMGVGIMSLPWGRAFDELEDD